MHQSEWNPNFRGRRGKYDLTDLFTESYFRSCPISINIYFICRMEINQKIGAEKDVLRRRNSLLGSWEQSKHCYLANEKQINWTFYSLAIFKHIIIVFLSFWIFFSCANILLSKMLWFKPSQQLNAIWLLSHFSPPWWDGRSIRRQR